MVYLFTKEGFITIQDAEQQERLATVEVSDGAKLYAIFMIALK